MGRRFIFKSIKGFTLLEVLIATAIMAISFGAMLHLTSEMSKINMIANANTDRQTLYKEINLILSNSAICTAAVKSQPVPTNGSNEIQMGIFANTQSIGRSQTFGNLQFEHVLLKDVRVVPPAASGLYIGTIEISYMPLYKAHRLTPGEFAIYFSRDASGAIDECYGSNVDLENFCEAIGGVFNNVSQSCDLSGFVRREACQMLNGTYNASTGSCNGGNFNPTTPPPPPQPSSCGGSSWVSGRCAQGQRVLRWSGTSQSQCWNICQASGAVCCAWSAFHGGRCSRDTANWPLQHQSNSRWQCR